MLVVQKQYTLALATYLITAVLLPLNIKMDRAISAPCNWKDVIYGINSRDKCYLTEIMNRLLKSLTTNCEGFGMLHYASNI